MGVLVTPDLFTEVTDIADVVAAACSLKKRDATDSCSRAIANAVEHAGSEHPLISELLGPAGEGLSNLMEYYAIDEVFALNLATTIGGAIVFIIVKNVVEKVKDNTDTGTSLLFNFGKPSTKSSSTGENNDSPTPDEHEACDKDVGTGLEAPFCRTCGGTSKSKTCTSVCPRRLPIVFVFSNGFRFRASGRTVRVSLPQWASVYRNPSAYSSPTTKSSPVAGTCPRHCVMGMICTICFATPSRAKTSWLRARSPM